MYVSSITQSYAMFVDYSIYYSMITIIDNAPWLVNMPRSASAIPIPYSRPEGAVPVPSHH